MQDSEPYVSKTANLRRRLQRLLSVPGEIFFADGKGELPMRRIVRGIGRVYHGEAPETDKTAVPT
jgi:hypothetical protein